MRRYVKAWLGACALVMVIGSTAEAQRTRLKPGMNLFTPEQDVELGRQVAANAEKQLPMLRNSKVDAYLNRLGKRLAAQAPGERYPYQFKCVNDSNVNAFALPGGFLYINRGTIEAADNEAELAGVVGHEIGHVALRHGTNQASKSQLAQAPLAILGSVLGSGSIGSVLAQIGTGFAVNSILLKYSRDDERESDLMGTHILYDAGYDPVYVARFFEKLEGRRGTDFFSSHPNPDNRIQNINAEIGRLGRRQSRAITDSAEFRSIKKYLNSLPPAPKAATQQGGGSRPRETAPPAAPSSRLTRYDGEYLSVRHPENWQAYGRDQAFTLAPEGGVVASGDSEALAYGVIVDVYEPRGDNPGLEGATNQLLKGLQNSNAGMRLEKERERIRVGGRMGLSTLLSNDSPLGGREVNWVVTVLRPEGLVYFIMVAPEQEFARYERSFRHVLNSASFK